MPAIARAQVIVVIGLLANITQQASQQSLVNSGILRWRLILNELQLAS